MNPTEQQLVKFFHLKRIPKNAKWIRLLNRTYSLINKVRNESFKSYYDYEIYSELEDIASHIEHSWLISQAEKKDNRKKAKRNALKKAKYLRDFLATR